MKFRIGSQQQRAALEQVWQLGGEVLSVNPVRRSLEQVFLELTAPAPAGAERISHR
ncbi:MAG: hypothetical protein JO266_18945 [Acidobacteria bacterium]|nr:hypothetical protein [Acidobacteriota bacterium]